jgi:phosphoribosylamine--glycine ligase
MRILVLGSGGREHALVWKLSQSDRIDKIFTSPGNAGTRLHGENVNIDIDNTDEIRNFIIDNDISMVVVGPEAPLVDGIRNRFQADDKLSGIPVIGPDRKGAMLEGSKDFAKDFMTRHGIPTARYRSFTSREFEQASAFLIDMQAPYVLKADGLAAGKGVLIMNDYNETLEELKAMFDGKFGSAGNKVVIEEYLDGIELSVFVLTDGVNYKILPEAKDYKRIGEGDTGLNTGGMGAISPVPFASEDFLRKVEEKIVKPTLDGLRKDDIDYKGFIFIGLMNCNGEPRVIEYNVRMGDPEAEVVIPRIDSDLLDLFEGVAHGNLDKKELKISSNTVTTVMLVSGGYPESYRKGMPVGGLDEVDNDSILFHAGTMFSDNKVFTSGGRVIAVSSVASDIGNALEASYRNAERIQFEGKYFRTDIGFDLK